MPVSHDALSMSLCVSSFVAGCVEADKFERRASAKGRVQACHVEDSLTT